MLCKYNINVCKQFSACGKPKLCFLELSEIFFKYFQSVVGWIHRYKTHGYGKSTMYLLEKKPAYRYRCRSME